jgi:hypothetical protein
MADRGWRNTELGGRQLEAQAARRGFERAQFGERRKLPHLPSLDESGSSALKIFDIASMVRIRRQWAIPPSRNG